MSWYCSFQIKKYFSWRFLMFDLKSLSNEDLIIQTKLKAQQERELTLEVLHFLREIERRRLFAQRGYSSLHAFCVEELKYSDPAAQRRIQAMRLLRDLPKTEEA